MPPVLRHAKVASFAAIDMNVFVAAIFYLNMTILPL